MSAFSLKNRDFRQFGSMIFVKATHNSAWVRFAINGGLLTNPSKPSKPVLKPVHRIFVASLPCPTTIMTSPSSGQGPLGCSWLWFFAMTPILRSNASSSSKRTARTPTTIPGAFGKKALANGTPYHRPLDLLRFAKTQLAAAPNLTWQTDEIVTVELCDTLKRNELDGGIGHYLELPEGAIFAIGVAVDRTQIEQIRLISTDFFSVNLLNQFNLCPILFYLFFANNLARKSFSRSV